VGNIDELIAPAVEAVGFEYVGAEQLQQGSGKVLRIYVDGPKGVTADDCASISHQVSAVLDVEEPFKGKYRLEVSSPGLDRPIFTLEQYKRFIGRSIKLKLKVPLEQRRNFSGALLAVDGQNVCLSAEGQELTFDFEDIEKASLIFEY